MLVKKCSKISIAIIAVFLVAAVLLGGCIKMPEGVTEEEEAVETEAAGEEETQEPAKEEAVEEEKGEQKQETEPAEEVEPGEEFFVNAILKSVDTGSSTITIEQLINEPNEQEVGPEVKLAESFKVVNSILIKKDGSEEEYQKQISLDRIPAGSEIGIKIENGKAVSIIYQIFIDAASQASIQEPDPENEFFVNAILKSVDTGSNTITIEQLINEPNEQEVDPNLALAGNYKAYITVVVRDNGENEYIKEVSLSEIPLGVEVGIIVNQDKQARAIIYMLSVE
ncbi:MAG: hypothetical protein R6U35_06420 [Candidatus Humimicrobiaceae bacterium]